MDPPDREESAAVADGGEPLKRTPDGKTLRQVVAEALGTPASTLERHLRSGDAREQREKIGDVVDIIEGSDTFDNRNTYDRIKFIPAAKERHLTGSAIAEYGLSWPRNRLVGKRFCPLRLPRYQ